MNRRLLIRNVAVACLMSWCWITQAPAQQDRFLVDENTVDAWIFQRFGNRQNATAALRSELDMQIKNALEQYDLTTQQVGQLKCAGHGDLKRFLDAADVLRRTIAGKSVRQHEFQLAWEATQPLQQRLQQGLYGEKSLFKKTLMGLLSEDQVSRLLEEQEARRQRQIRSIARSFLSELSPNVPMTAKQMEALAELLVNDMNVLQNQISQEEYLVDLAVSRLKEDQLASILDDQLVKYMLQLKKQRVGMGAILLREEPRNE